MFLSADKNIGKFIFSASCSLLIVAFLLVISAFFYDFSYDGQAYHQDIILQLNNGWNPFYEHHAPKGCPSIAIWVNHYCKGLETISATIFSMTGNIESGKVVNFIIIFASGFLFFDYLNKFFQFLSNIKKTLLAFMFTLCPVVICQMFTYYIDWAAYSLLLILIPALIGYEKEQSKIYLGIICSVIIMAAVIKFNLIFWACFIIFVYFIYLYFVKKHSQQLIKKLLIASIISGFFAIFFIGFNPYITNTIDHKHPMYPLMGEEKVDIMDSNTPPVFKEMSRFESVFISMFAVPNNSISKQWTVKTIFSANSKSMYLRFPSIDTRIGGLGIFFSWSLLVALLLYLTLIIYIKDFFKNKERNNYNFVLITLFISLFILPYSWWARYFPFFYAFPLIMCLYFERENNKNKIFFLKIRYLIYMLLIINTLSISWSSIINAKYFKKEINNGIGLFSKSTEPVLINFGHNVGLKIKMDKKKVKYKETNEILGTKFFHPEVTLDSAKYVLNNNHKLIEK